MTEGNLMKGKGAKGKKDKGRGATDMGGKSKEWKQGQGFGRKEKER